MKFKEMQLTKNFKLSEFLKSETADKLGIDNMPNEEQINNLKTLCENVLQPLRDWLGEPITITSGYRCDELNKAINGSPTSDHVNGKAADFYCSDKAKAYKWMSQNLDYDQLIWEKGDDVQPNWIHVGYRCKTTNRKQTFRIK